MQVVENDFEQKMRKLSALKDDGLITEQEYREKRAQNIAKKMVRTAFKANFISEKRCGRPSF